jgi:hypothetical protein
MVGHHVKIGGLPQSDGKWRCKICKFSNESDSEKC